MATKPVIFISGPMSTHPDLVQASFQTAIDMLEAKDWTTLSALGLNPKLKRDKAMPICLSMLTQSDAVYFLEGWKDSVGSRAEYSYAKAIGKPCFEGIMPEVNDVEL